jgi:hypothetical protein
MAALHQRDAESALQFREGLRNAWLRSLKLGRGFAEALKTRDRHENPQLLKIWKINGAHGAAPCAELDVVALQEAYHAREGALPPPCAAGCLAARQNALHGQQAG